VKAFAEKVLRRPDQPESSASEGGELQFKNAVFVLEYGMKGAALDLEKEMILNYYRTLTNPGFTLHQADPAQAHLRLRCAVPSRPRSYPRRRQPRHPHPRGAARGLTSVFTLLISMSKAVYRYIRITQLRCGRRTARPEQEAQAQSVQGGHGGHPGDVYKEGEAASPPDAELEVIAQTWSEHFKHRIFGAKITHTLNGQTETSRQLVQDLHAAMRPSAGQWSRSPTSCFSAFVDNAGFVEAGRRTRPMCLKAETHNHPRRRSSRMRARTRASVA